MKNIPEVVLTNVSNRIDYYQWFLYGFMLMEKKGKIILKYRTSMTQRMLMSNLFWPLAKLIYKLRFIVMKRLGKYDPKNKSLLRGYVKIRDERKSFCIDSADAPFLSLIHI